MEETCSDRASITIALNTHASALQGHTHALGGLASDKEHTGSGCIVTAFATSNRERLAGDDSGNRVASMHGVGIHNPCHHLRVCIDIRCGDIAMRANNDRYFSRIAVCQAFYLSGTHILWGAYNAAFCSTVGNTDDGTLPGLPHIQPLDFVECQLSI